MNTTAVEPQEHLGDRADQVHVQHQFASEAPGPSGYHQKCILHWNHNPAILFEPFLQVCMDAVFHVRPCHRFGSLLKRFVVLLERTVTASATETNLWLSMNPDLLADKQTVCNGWQSSGFMHRPEVYSSPKRKLEQNIAKQMIEQDNTGLFTASKERFPINHCLVYPEKLQADLVGIHFGSNIVMFCFWLVSFCAM